MAKKHILGLDLGTTSIGWAHVIEGDSIDDSEIKQIGARVNPLTVDEQTDFERGRPLSTNANRTLNRGARRNLDRYQMRRKVLIDTLMESGIINDKTTLNEDEKNSTHETWRLRAQSATERVELNEFARILLAINKKRGYKSSRKTKGEEEGQAVDGMGIAKRLYEEGITPGQLVFSILIDGGRVIPDFYRSDLKAEFDAVWEFQKQFYPDILTNEFYQILLGKGQRATSALFWATYKFNIADVKELEDGLKTEKTIKLNTRQQKRLQAYKWRNDAISKQLSKEQMAYVLTEINNNINNSSGYLGAISDRSKELYFNQLTVGQYLYQQIKNNPHTSLKNQVFYRQDYLDEFEKIWDTQAKYYNELTPKLKEEIRNIAIFYQRPLKSQKGLISFCEFESQEKIIKGKKKTIGSRVAPKSSHLFQEFKIWQNLHHVLIKSSDSKDVEVESELIAYGKNDTYVLADDAKALLFEELNLKGNLKSNTIFEILGYKARDWKLNYTSLEGNRTNQALYNAYLKILEIEGYDEDLLKLSDKDDIDVGVLKTSAVDIKQMVKSIFELLEINTEILEFNAQLEGKAFEQQASYQLWHLLYAAQDDFTQHSEEDIFLYGKENISLKKQLCEKFGFKPEHAKILVNVNLQDDYGSLSTKAMRKIYPFIIENQYSDACVLAGYRHSKHSLTKEEIENKVLADRLELLPKNSLRNPVVEKILNQMVNVVNALIDKGNDELEAEGKERSFKFDEIRIELARELKRNASERAEMTTNINKAKTEYEKIRNLLQSEFGLANPTRNDIIRYRLYEELKDNGYKDLYTNTYIPREILFTKNIDIEHIIPQSKLFDDSFSNKTLAFRKDNLEKSNQTSFDYIKEKYSKDKFDDYCARVDSLHKSKVISPAKHRKLLMLGREIGDGFIERDLRDSQYIAKKAKEILGTITKSVVSTTGQVTNRLREDWGLINVMKELNLPKYRALGLTEIEERKYGQHVEVIKDWTKRNDHRHHAMDALVIAFTKRNHVQYLNYLNARTDTNHRLHSNIKAIEDKEMELVVDEKGNRKRLFKTPIINFRQLAKEHLESVLISHKAKNKVVTINRNKIVGKEKPQITLTPRGQLHKETVYGKYKYYESKEEKIGAKFDENTINKIANPKYREALWKRFVENNMDAKKAFTGKNALSKNPIYVDESQGLVVPEKVQLVWLEENYSIRKEVNPDNFNNVKSIDKILDEGIKRVMLERLKAFDNNAKEAFSNLNENPIWLNKEKGISVKRVKITGVKNAETLHYKKDHHGDFILDDEGQKIPSSYVSTGNNHHVAIYRDEKGKLQECVVSFFEAVERVNLGLPIIDKSYNRDLGWEFLFTMKQNEMFVFPNEETGFDPNEIDLLDPENKSIISPNLFRVQKFTIKDYFFRHHLETNVDNNRETSNVLWKRGGLSGLLGIIKVRINHLGDIVQIGEY